ncbi:hypothetical protein J6590_075022 [Homalodisca vitripennis]|nr:hypothetical protein J6590_075022 [Homalodisca vitripennis]
MIVIQEFITIVCAGHNVPLICSRGFTLLSMLQSCQLYTAVISLLQHLVPLFLDCPSTLVESDNIITTGHEHHKWRRGFVEISAKFRVYIAAGHQQ